VVRKLIRSSNFGSSAIAMVRCCKNSPCGELEAGWVGRCLARKDLWDVEMCCTQFNSIRPLEMMEVFCCIRAPIWFRWYESYWSINKLKCPSNDRTSARTLPAPWTWLRAGFSGHRLRWSYWLLRLNIQGTHYVDTPFLYIYTPLFTTYTPP